MSRLPCIGLVGVCLLAGWIQLRQGAPVLAEGVDLHQDPNAVCAPCHGEIYRRYRTTPMANASGPAAAGLIPADFVHEASGVHFTVSLQGTQAWLTYERDDPRRALNGRQELKYFIGSGRRGRTYLFEQQGYWFESPINWYAKKQTWDMAPNHLTDREVPLTLPVDPGCLHCHASGVSSALPDARNHYVAAPFSAGGITCVACHGNGDAHLASNGKVHMSNLDALEPIRRDSICLSCHLEGQAAINREGKSPQNFVPGDNLFEYTAFFIYEGERGSGGRATSQWEALLKSECKQKSGDRMTCTTCHDPHGSPPSEERAGFYRKRCLQCHDQERFEVRHHPENPDCTSCHMARPPSNDIAHEQVTDHWIRKRVSQQRLPLITAGVLKTVGSRAADDRDLGLAYAEMAERGDKPAAVRALALLEQTEKKEGGAVHDHELHAQLGFLEEVSGHPEEAAAEYRQALDADAYDSLAGGNLALIEAQRHDYVNAERLWRAVFEHDPVEIGAGQNLALVECGLEERTAAQQTLTRMLTFAPDDDQARRMLAEIRQDGPKCAQRTR